MANSHDTERALPSKLIRNHWVQAGAVLALLLALVLVGLPYAMSHVLQQWLLTHGGEQVRIENIDFNPFAGSARIEQLHVQAGGDEPLVVPRLELRFNWLPLVSRQLHVRAVHVDGVRLQVEQTSDGVLAVGGIILSGDDPETGGDTWEYGIDELLLKDTVVDYRAPELRFVQKLDRLELRRLTSWTSESATLLVEGALNEAVVRLDGELPPMASGTGFKGQVRVEGLDLADLGKIVQPGLAVLSGRLGLDAHVNVLYTAAGRLELAQKGQIRLGELRLRQNEGEDLSATQLQWEGKTSLAQADKEGGLVVTANGALTGDGLVLDLPTEAVELRQDRLAWNGEANYRADPAPGIRAAGQLVLAGLGMEAGKARLQLLRFDELIIDRFDLQGLEALTLDGLAIKGATFARDLAAEVPDATPAVLQAGAISVNRAELSDGSRLAIDIMEWRDATSVVRRDPEGVWQLVRIIDTLPFTGRDATVEQPEADATTGAEPGPGGVAISTLKVTGSSAVLLEDAGVVPPVKLRLDLAEAEMAAVDSARPLQDSPLTLKASMGKHGRIDLEGSVRPFDSKVSLALDALVEGVALVPLSPYAIQSIGHRLKSGHLDADSTIQIDQGKLTVSNQLTMRGLDVEPVSGEQLEALQRQSSVPLGSALNMLRDKHNTIRVQLPVSGDIGSPDFDINDAINQAVGKAMKQGAMTYLTMALQPYGSLITAARLVGEAVAKVRLDPVVFASASALLEESRHDYLEKVAGILKERPEVNIKLCGVATESDRQTLMAQSGVPVKQTEMPIPQPPPVQASIGDEQLLALAAQRDEAVRDYLVDRHAVQATRLVACEPILDVKADAAPRVDLLI